MATIEPSYPCLVFFSDYNPAMSEIMFCWV